MTWGMSLRVRHGPALKLRVGHLLHPVHRRAVQLFLDGDVAHCRGLPGPVPVLLPGWEPHNVARADFLDRATLALHPAASGGDDERLPERGYAMRYARLARR